MKTNATHCVQCPHCQGQGSIPLPPHLSETLIYLRQQGARSAPQLKQALMPKSASASGMNNRLDALEKLGLIRCIRVEGKTKFWEATDPETEE